MAIPEIFAKRKDPIAGNLLTWSIKRNSMGEGNMVDNNAKYPEMWTFYK